jgi:hypothetical protein
MQSHIDFASGKRILMASFLGLSLVMAPGCVGAQTSSTTSSSTSSSSVTAVKLADVTVEVFNGSAQFFTIPFFPNMTFQNAMELALPTSSPSGSFSANYFPQFYGYFITAVGGVPAPGVQQFWSTCLLPAGAGSTVFALPLGPNRIIMGPGDLAILAFNTDCTTVPNTVPHS